MSGGRRFWIYIGDLSGRLANRVQLTTDGHIDYAMLVKL